MIVSLFPPKRLGSSEVDDFFLGDCVTFVEVEEVDSSLSFLGLVGLTLLDSDEVDLFSVVFSCDDFEHLFSAPASGISGLVFFSTVGVFALMLTDASLPPPPTLSFVSVEDCDGPASPAECDDDIVPLDGAPTNLLEPNDAFAVPLGVLFMMADAILEMLIALPPAPPPLPPLCSCWEAEFGEILPPCLGFLSDCGNPFSWLGLLPPGLFPVPVADVPALVAVALLFPFPLFPFRPGKLGTINLITAVPFPLLLSFVDAAGPSACLEPVPPMSSSLLELLDKFGVLTVSVVETDPPTFFSADVGVGEAFFGFSPGRLSFITSFTALAVCSVTRAISSASDKSPGKFPLGGEEGELELSLSFSFDFNLALEAEALLLLQLLPLSFSFLIAVVDVDGVPWEELPPIVALFTLMSENVVGAVDGAAELLAFELQLELLFDEEDSNDVGFTVFCLLPPDEDVVDEADEPGPVP